MGRWGRPIGTSPQTVGFGKGDVLRTLFIIALIAIAMLAVAVYRAKLGAHKSEIAIDTLQTEVVSLREEVDVLRNELAHLSREKRLDEIARKELGMQPIRPEQIVTPDELSERLEGVRNAANETASLEQEGRQ